MMEFTKKLKMVAETGIAIIVSHFGIPTIVSSAMAGVYMLVANKKILRQI